MPSDPKRFHPYRPELKEKMQRELKKQMEALESEYWGCVVDYQFQKSEKIMAEDNLKHERELYDTEHKDLIEHRKRRDQLQRKIKSQNDGSFPHCKWPGITRQEAECERYRSRCQVLERELDTNNEELERLKRQGEDIRSRRECLEVEMETQGIRLELLKPWRPIGAEESNRERRYRRRTEQRQ
ncbi:hypothetical protein PQX77_014971 [Marasmius sp. AFHP31]|nr:hypothetical protein PQX77_014971 [Marasmius sp. AFHP31]